MLLRRIKHHVANENWFAVFVDFVIVVVGVYVGIEVSNWNEARKEEALATQYLERLRADLQADEDMIDARRQFWEHVGDYGDAAIAYLESGRLRNESPWATVLAFYQASQVAHYFSTNTTYEELRYSGELSLIRNPELEAAFADYYISGVGQQANYLLQYQPEYRELIRGKTPWHVQQYIWESCHADGTTLVDQQMLECDAPIDPSEAATILADYAADPETIEQLRFWISNLSVAGRVLAINRARLARLTELVDRELEPGL